MEGSYNLVTEISHVSEFWVLLVQVSRIWFPSNMIDETIPNSTEIVFVDEMVCYYFICGIINI